MPIAKVCAFCEEPFLASENRIRFCGKRCSIDARSKEADERSARKLAEFKEIVGRRIKEPPAHADDVDFDTEILGKTVIPWTKLEYPFPEAAAAPAPPIVQPDILPYKIGKRILVIPDTQVKPGCDQSHIKWIGQYIADKRPDIIVMIGDWWDMQSLCSYDKGKRCFEGRRYIDDVKAGNDAMDLMTSQYRHLYKPEEHFFIGNHEERIERAQETTPELAGAIGYHHLNLKGWIVHGYEEVAEIEGIKFAHYFTSGLYGKPVSSAAVMMRVAQGSAIQGHAQKVDIAVHEKTGTIAMMVGIAYRHDEGYLGPQGNNCRRQVVVLNEVRDGIFDPMMVSLAYLEKRYGG